MKKKLLFPVMAMVFAIGLSFATEKSTTDPNMDYYLDNGQYIPIGQEVKCGDGAETCSVRLEEDAAPVTVYDDAFGTIKHGSGEIVELWENN